MKAPQSLSMSPRSRRAVDGPREQAKTCFTEILARLVCATPGAAAAALVDYEGETVDYAGKLDPFELKVTAAHWQIVLFEIGTLRPAAGMRQITARAGRRSYVVRLIHPGYTVVLVLHRRAAFAVSERALQEAEARLCEEAGWDRPPRETRWFGVDVETDAKDRSRPSRMRVADSWHPVEVMGFIVGLGPREKGFRVRLPSGAEMLLVRERSGRWFADEHMQD